MARGTAGRPGRGRSGRSGERSPSLEPGRLHKSSAGGARLGRPPALPRLLPASSPVLPRATSRSALSLALPRSLWLEAPGEQLQGLSLGERRRRARRVPSLPAARTPLPSKPGGLSSEGLWGVSSFPLLRSLCVCLGVCLSPPTLSLEPPRALFSRSSVSCRAAHAPLQLCALSLFSAVPDARLSSAPPPAHLPSLGLGSPPHHHNPVRRLLLAP